jgi:hypothetical protein
MAKPKKAKVVAPLKVGDRVKIRLAGKLGRIVELRGPLGPGGAPVYRVLVQRKPNVSIELRGDQLEVAPGRRKRVGENR